MAYPADIEDDGPALIAVKGMRSLESEATASLAIWRLSVHNLIVSRTPPLDERCGQVCCADGRSGVVLSEKKVARPQPSTNPCSNPD